MHASQIAASAATGVLTIQKVEKTTETPVRAYRIVFLTNDASLMSHKSGSSDRAAFLIDQGVSLAWKAKFCTSTLLTAMGQNGIRMVSGQIVDGAGEIQAIAICNA